MSDWITPRGPTSSQILEITMQELYQIRATLIHIEEIEREDPLYFFYDEWMDALTARINQVNPINGDIRERKIQAWRLLSLCRYLLRTIPRISRASGDRSAV